LARRFAARFLRLAGSTPSAFPAGCLDLLGFLKPEDKLVLRQALGPSAEAVTLQFLDDLAAAEHSRRRAPAPARPDRREVGPPSSP